MLHLYWVMEFGVKEDTITTDIKEWLMTKGFTEVDRNIIEKSQIEAEDLLVHKHKCLNKEPVKESLGNMEESSVESQTSFLKGFSLSSKSAIANIIKKTDNVSEHVTQPLRKSRRKSKPRRVFCDDFRELDCKYCGKELGSYSGLLLHESKCTIKKKQSEDLESMKLELKEEDMSGALETSDFKVSEKVKCAIAKRLEKKDVEIIDDSKDLSCEYCCKTFKHSLGLRSHVALIHAPKETFICMYCQAIFDNKKKFSEHVLHSHNVRKAFSCDQCENAYELKDSLKRHMKVHNECNTLKCEECGKKFTEKITLQNHMMIHTGEKPYKCAECGMAFRDPSTMRKHVKRHAPERPFKCETCGKMFASTYDMKKHARIHMNDEERPYKCEVCGKGFYLIAAMKTHLRIHYGERPYKCETCGFAFTDASNLHTHRMSHTNTRNFQCDICGHTFKWISNLNRHIQIVHEKQKLFCCGICGKQFGQKGAMQIHEFTHRTDRPYKCEECGKDFTCKTALKSHQRVHSTVKKFVCDICDKGFNRGIQLKKHLLRCGKKGEKGKIKLDDIHIDKSLLDGTILQREIIVRDIDYSKILSGFEDKMENFENSDDSEPNFADGPLSDESNTDMCKEENDNVTVHIVDRSVSDTLDA